MATLRLPQADPAIPSAHVQKWLAPAGAAIAEGDPLVILEAETGLVELSAPTAGRLTRILAPAGAAVAVGDALAEIDDDATGEAPRQTEAPAAAAPADGPAAPSGGDSDAVTVIVMPQAGQSMEEGIILKWMVAPGDRIEVGQMIFEVETDKANIEIESDHSGRLARILVAEGEMALVKAPVALLADNDSDAEAWVASQQDAQSGPEPAETTAATPPSPTVSDRATDAAPSAVAAAPLLEGDRIKASPAARAAARERGVDLRAVGAGRGPGGRILSTDVRAATDAAPGEPIRRKLAGMRKAIARNLTASKQNIPHFYMRMTFDAAAMVAYHRNRKQQFPCSLNDVIVLACGRVMAAFPAFRTRLEGDELVELPTANIGVAVGLDDGLVVPVVVGADRMNLEGLAGRTRAMIDNAKKGRIENMGQGAFTISNLGMFGIEEFSAIINPPEAAILAVSAIRETVVVHDGAMRPGRVMTVTLSCDHRVIDGLLAAQFMARLKECLEGPEEHLG